jgi:hypothetical protein
MFVQAGGSKAPGAEPFSGHLGLADVPIGGIYIANLQHVQSTRLDRISQASGKQIHPDKHFIL